MTLRVGSLCSGVGMIDLAVESVLPGAELAWYAQYEPGKDGKPDTKQYAARIMAHHWPGIPNLGDITAIDYSDVPRVDILTAGFPCTDVSLAGKRAGLRAGTRSGVWTHVARAIGELRPSLVLIENVRSLTSAWADSDLEPCPWCVGDGGGEHSLRALACVLGDLADLGFDAEWLTLAASAVGAPHRRERVFVLAWPTAEDAHDAARDQRRIAAPGQAQGGRARSDARGRGGAPAAHPAGAGHGDARAPRVGGPPAAPLASGATATSDAQGVGRGEGRPEPARVLRGPHAPECSGTATLDAACVGRRPEGQQRRLGATQRGEGASADTDRDALREQPVTLCGGGRSTLAGAVGAEAASNAHGHIALDSELPDRWDAVRRGLRPDSPGRGAATADTGRDPWTQVDADRSAAPGCGGDAPADADGGRRGAGEPGDAAREPGAGGRGRFPWESTEYGPAIARWEAVLGRPAPWPVDDRGRLSPHLPEFMMGLPEGWVTAVPGVTRNAQLHALGNGCVVQQAAEALRLLLPAYLAETAEPALEAVAA